MANIIKEETVRYANRIASLNSMNDSETKKYEKILDTLPVWLIVALYTNIPDKYLDMKWIDMMKDEGKLFNEAFDVAWSVLEKEGVFDE